MYIPHIYVYTTYICIYHIHTYIIYVCTNKSSSPFGSQDELLSAQLVPRFELYCSDNPIIADKARPII